MKKQFRFTDEQLKAVLDASKPTPAMWDSQGNSLFGTPQENANSVWRRLGKEMGFVWDTGEPAGTGDQHDFIAEPL